jgi:Protein of unknown function (DUF1329)
MARLVKTVALPRLAGCAFISLLAFTTSVVRAQSRASDPSQSARARPPAGTTIDTANLSAYEQIIPAAAQLAVTRGFTIRIIPTERLDWPGSFTAATEKYSAQVGLDNTDAITNYVAGMPFPIFNLGDPKAAIKIAYNWHMGPFMPDDFELAPWGSYAYSSTGAPNSFVAEEPNNYVCANFHFLRFAHRTEVEPRPTLGANPDGVEWKARCDDWTSDADGHMGPWPGAWNRMTPWTRPVAAAINRTGRTRFRRPNNFPIACWERFRCSRALQQSTSLKVWCKETRLSHWIRSHFSFATRTYSK